jgi:hypothetical protein
VAKICSITSNSLLHAGSVLFAFLAGYHNVDRACLSLLLLAGDVVRVVVSVRAPRVNWCALHIYIIASIARILVVILVTFILISLLSHSVDRDWDAARLKAVASHSSLLCSSLAV